jgi:hypothetical protein
LYPARAYTDTTHAVFQETEIFPRFVGENPTKLPGISSLDPIPPLHNPSVTLHNPSVIPHNPSIALHNSSIILHKPSIALHNPSIRLHNHSVIPHNPSIILHNSSDIRSMPQASHRGPQRAIFARWGEKIILAPAQSLAPQLWLC